MKVICERYGALITNHIQIVCMVEGSRIVCTCGKILDMSGEVVGDANLVSIAKLKEFFSQ